MLYSIADPGLKFSTHFYASSGTSQPGSPPNPPGRKKSPTENPHVSNESKIQPEDGGPSSSSINKETNHHRLLCAQRFVHVLQCFPKGPSSQKMGWDFSYSHFYLGLEYKCKS